MAKDKEVIPEKVAERTFSNDILESPPLKAYENNPPSTFWEHRDRQARLESAFPKADNVQVTQLNFPITGGYVLAQLFRPKTLQPIINYPTLIVVPGNAFVADAHQVNAGFCSQLANQANAQVFLIPHPLAPEHIFPTQLNWITESLGYLSRNAATYNIDVGYMAAVGYSSGANLLVSSLAQRPVPTIKHLYLLSPLLDLSRSSMEDGSPYKKQEVQDSIVSEEYLRWSIRLYAGQTDLKNPVISPLWLEDEKLLELPKTTIYVGENDRVYGDAVRFAAKLDAFGLLLAKVICPSQSHAYAWVQPSIIKMLAATFEFNFNCAKPHASSSKPIAIPKSRQQALPESEMEDVTTASDSSNSSSGSSSPENSAYTDRTHVNMYGKNRGRGKKPESAPSTPQRTVAMDVDLSTIQSEVQEPPRYSFRPRKSSGSPTGFTSSN